MNGRRARELRRNASAAGAKLAEADVNLPVNRLRRAFKRSWVRRVAVAVLGRMNGKLVGMAIDARAKA